ncbi:MAG: TlpA family protein disulfide reductase [Methylophaga sp.]|jgi:thiol-disulfide isomerase/thioredoxin|uniref:TlpA family protein disulfide reductase n=1 Tax=Methylophaga sp. TaxID=2024840 RepID=UPI000C1224E9|nr:TlpA disulfide reductase family protein [Methylophaga sp.]MBL1459055.1 TlpA family protein disulfide reductase [Methylophaga sp.]
MISIGPYSIRIVIIMIAAIVGWLLSRFIAKYFSNIQPKTASSLYFDAFLVGIFIARMTFVLVWWNDYIATPWTIVAIGDGGFYAASGIIAAIAWIWWKTRQEKRLRKPVYAGMLAGLIAWGGASGGMAMIQPSSPSLPELELSTIDSKPHMLTSYVGQPVVVNLWATWCPPCRREMPVFMKAQSDYQDIAVVMINQGESMQEITSFLASEGLELEHVLLDQTSKTMREFGARGLPTTLFFDAEGRMVHSHMGEMTMPSLKNTIKKFFME